MRLKRRLAHYSVDAPVISLDQLSLSLDSVPGMMSPEAGPTLFILSITQRIRGDIIEIGSWQGRSTIFLAKGALASQNGRVYAVDHFQGNPGKTGLYRVHRNDLSDLPDGFRRNVSEFDVARNVELLVMPSQSAAKKLAERNIRARMLFIDGNHDYNAVSSDFAAFKSLLLPGALVVFDDYSAAFPGVTRCVSDMINARLLKPLFCFGNCFVGEFLEA
jgi:MMP 1-O-methyltransferase